MVFPPCASSVSSCIAESGQLPCYPGRFSYANVAGPRVNLCPCKATSCLVTRVYQLTTVSPWSPHRQIKLGPTLELLTSNGGQPLIRFPHGNVLLLMLMDSGFRLDLYVNKPQQNITWQIENYKQPKENKLIYSLVSATKIGVL